MEATLDTYAAPPDPAVPLVCFDESGLALQDHVYVPIPRTQDRRPREDPEYRRRGQANLFMMYAPHLGWRHVSVTTQRTSIDFAVAMRDLCDVHFPDAARITVVLDNLNTHRLDALYQAFPAPEARRLARKLDLRFTPKHGSWLNMAEFELSALKRQCLARRIGDRLTLQREVRTWAAARNTVAAPAKWAFTIDKARTRLVDLYPIAVCERTDSLC